MGNAGSMDQHPDFRGHNMPLKLPMPDPGELEERFASVLVSTAHWEKRESISSVFLLFFICFRLSLFLLAPHLPGPCALGTRTAVCVCVDRLEPLFD